MLGAMGVILEGDRRQAEALAPRRQLGHHAIALLVAHRAPARDLVEGAAAAHARVALRIHDADLHARAFHFALAAMARAALEAGCLPSTPQIHWPIATSLSRSTPVWIPRPLSM